MCAFVWCRSSINLRGLGVLRGYLQRGILLSEGLKVETGCQVGFDVPDLQTKQKVPLGGEFLC